VNVADSQDASIPPFEYGWTASSYDSLVGPTTGTLDCGAQATWTASPGADENLPINCVDWAEAYAFCIWDGGFLPSYDELQYAQMGGPQQLTYPWGSTAPGTNSQYAIYGNYYTGTSLGIAPVGFAPLGAGVWGQLDLAGNVNEWSLDSNGGPCQGTDCVYEVPGPSRTFSGGAFDSPASALTSPQSSQTATGSRDVYIGLRCARAP
jgi:formylglycine-generating enzyme required for sulfatase activity